MISRLKHRLVGTEEKKRLISNISALGVWQVTSYILPLLTLPYLVRVLEPEYFGLLAFASVTSGYFTLISEYGFNLSATRKISICRDDLEQVNRIFNAVMIIKFGLMLASFVLMSLLVFCFARFSQNWEVYFITFGTVIGQVLFPSWLFQGMERMKYIAGVHICVRVFVTICIFIFVQDQSDYLYVPLLSSLGLIVAGIWSLYVVKKEFHISFNLRTTILTTEAIKEQLYDGWHMFIPSIFTNLYTLSITFFLGIFANNTVVGYFSSADKIIRAASGLYDFVGRAIYPLVSRKIHQNKQAGMTFIKKISLISGIGTLVISILLLLLADPIIYWLLGEQYQEAVLPLQIMALLPFTTSMSNILGIQIMLNLGYKQALNNILMISVFLSVGLSLIFVPTYGALGSASIALVGGIFVTITMFVFLLIELRNGI